MSSPDEQRAASANYVIQFFQQVEALSQAHAIYVNVAVEMENMYGAEPDKLEEQHRAKIVQAAQDLRYHSQRAWIIYSSIAQKKRFAEENVRTMQACYLKVRDVLLPDRNDSEAYTQSMNDELTSSVMQELLTTSQDTISKVYDKE